MTLIEIRRHVKQVERETLSNVQVLRFVAAAGILVLHAADLFLPNDWLFWSEPWTAGVDIFFIISGFIMTYLTRGHFAERGAPRAFLVRRLIRIAPPYWLFTTLMIAAVFLFREHLGDATLGTSQIVTSYAFIPWPGENRHLIPILAQGWTLNYEVFFYVSFAAALAFRRGLALLAAAFIGLVAMHPLLPQEAFVLSFWSDPIILEFLAGIALAGVYLKGLRLSLWASILCAALAPIVFVGTQFADLGMFNRIAHLGAPAFLLSASLMLAPEPSRIGPLRKALQSGGGASYTLYLSHVFTVGAAHVAWRQTGLHAPWLGMTLAMIIAVAVAAVVYRWVERPMTDYLQAQAGLKPAPRAADVAP